MRSLLQAEVLNAYIEADVIPKGLIIRKEANVDKRNEEFHKEWNFVLKEFSLRLMEFLIDYYERSVPENEAEIEECYRVMMEENEWTECNRSEFDKEMKAIIVKKEKELRAEKIKKLQKIGRKKETQAQVLYKSNSETYAEVLKKHIQERLKTRNKSTSSKSSRYTVRSRKQNENRRFPQQRKNPDKSVKEQNGRGQGGPRPFLDEGQPAAKRK